jgi:alginate production protein
MRPLLRTSWLAWLLLFATPSLATMSAADWERLLPGLVVEADGSWKPGAPFRAKEIDIRTDRLSGDQVELIGPLQSIDAGARTIQILDLIVTLPDSCKIRTEDRTPLALSDLSPDEWLEVDASGAKGALRARRIKRRNSDPGKEQIEGTITAVDAGRRTLEIAGIEFRVSKSATIRGGVILALPRAIDDDHAHRTAWSALGGRIRGGGRFQYEYEPETEFDLNPARPGNHTRSNWAIDMHVDALLTPQLEAFTRFGQRGRRIIFDDEGDEANLSQWNLKQAYVVWRPRPLLALQVGRQDFDEPREWLYDENLDGVRLRFATGRWRGEASVSTRFATISSRQRDRTNWILVVGREMKRLWLSEAYVIRQAHLRQTDDAPVWLGLRSHGRFRSGVRHWLELSALRGTRLGEQLDAYAWDAGLQLRLLRRTRLTVTVGWAYGSGGPNPGDHYEQTGFQDNNDKFGGVASFKYYGELLDPELSNLSIETIGMGMRPTKRSSVDFVIHRYRQPHPQQRLFHTNLETQPRGGSREVGHEWDLIVAFEEIPNLDIEYVLARFEPGSGFDERATRALFHKLSVVFNF